MILTLLLIILSRHAYYSFHVYHYSQNEHMTDVSTFTYDSKTSTTSIRCL